MANKEDDKKQGGFHAMEERTKELQRQQREHEDEENRNTGERSGSAQERSVGEDQKRS
ncbi:MAG TPA: hypothetical protein V6D22_22910 [Candidatus Obscuribacterales bacterium]